MVECPRCGGDMREGEAFVQFTTSEGQTLSGFGVMGIPERGIPMGETTREENIMWREGTGVKRGWLIKREEKKTLKISGRRCTECGYLELYANE